MSDDPLHSIRESARLLGGVSISTVERLLHKGQLARVKIRNRTLIRESELARLIKKGERQAIE